MSGEKPNLESEEAAERSRATDASKAMSAPDIITQATPKAGSPATDAGVAPPLATIDAGMTYGTQPGDPAQQPSSASTSAGGGAGFATISAGSQLGPYRLLEK